MISYTCRGYNFEVNQFANIDSIVDIVRKMQLKIQKKWRLDKFGILNLRQKIMSLIIVAFKPL